MRLRLFVGTLGLFAAMTILLSGCKPGESTPTKGNEKGTTTVADNKQAEGKHSGWWCREHGIPEDECLLCLIENGKVSEQDLITKGDWCDKHDRPKSQCFICDAKLREKYADRYRAKFGKEPPPIDDDEKEKKDDTKKGKK